MVKHRPKKVVESQPSQPPDAPKADRNVQEIAMGVPDKGGEVASAAPLQPSSSGCWFERTWHFLFISHLLNAPDEIVAFSVTARSVSVRLASGQEYNIDKGKL